MRAEGFSHEKPPKKETTSEKDPVVSGVLAHPEMYVLPGNPPLTSKDLTRYTRGNQHLLEEIEHTPEPTEAIFRVLDQFPEVVRDELITRGLSSGRGRVRDACARQIVLLSKESAVKHLSHFF